MMETSVATRKGNGRQKDDYGGSSSARTAWRHLFLALQILFAGQALLACYKSSRNVLEDPMSVYVPGAGFSGFWFSLGRLMAIPDRHERNYYCFSAGCLGVVAALTNVTVDRVEEVAFGIQNEWKAGRLSRFELAGVFVDELVPPHMELDADVLDRVNVLTTTKGVGVNVRRARTKEELREMLVQTTWIPFATGWGLWKKDKLGHSHMDGGALMLLHPKCQSQLSLPLQFELFWHMLNPNLRKEQVDKFLTAGAKYGVA